MPRNIRWDESVKENTLYLVEALLRHADNEFEDEELKAVVYVEWVTENKLRVTGKKVKQISGKRNRTIEVGTRKEYLLELVTKTGKSLKVHKFKNETSTSLQNRELNEIQTALDCLKELGVREDEQSVKNQGYWKFILRLKYLTATQEENLDVVRRLWREHPRTNLSETSKFTNSQSLDLSGNQITSLPPEIFQFTNPQSLDLSGNQLTSLPLKIFQLTNLQSLDLSGNQLTSLPLKIFQLTNLQSLDLSGNQLTSLPPQIGQLTNLQSLNLRGNQLISLPSEIQQLPNLKKLDIRDNPLPIPPDILWSKGLSQELGDVKEILDYYFQVQDPNEIEPIYEAKLLIIGEGRSGKTSFINKIKNANYELQSDDNSTQGINITQWHFTLPNERNFRVNIWDFSGQEIYYQTQQFFFTKNSLYVLVSDTRTENTDFYWWLKVVEILSDNSPVLIIKNEKQDHQCEINERLLRGEFVNLREVLSTNLATNRGLLEIKQAIQDYISTLPIVGKYLPKPWMRVRFALENDSHNYISLEKYFQLCRVNSLTDEQDMLLLSSDLHDLGVCLHFQNDSTLKHYVILKPEWGTTAVYKVLDNKTVKQNLGCFTQVDIEDIWQDVEYADMRDALLQLMMQFKLCYPIPHRPGNYIAPQLLSIYEPDYTWDDTNNLILHYKYEFMPKGILTNFIVETYPWIEQQNLVWRTGVILNKDQTRAEIIEQYEQKEIKIRVAGNRKKELLAVVTHELEKIHQSFERLQYYTLVPCNCTFCKGSSSPSFYSLDILHRRLKASKYLVECENSFETVDIRRLIDDVLIIDTELKSQVVNLSSDLLTLNKSISSANSYLEQIESQGYELLYEAKILIVGEPGAGKTSLMKKLIDPTYQIPNKEESTLGIVVNSGWECSEIKEDKKIRFTANIWDFGGQEVQYALHQFFLTSRSLYVLVVDDREQRTEFDYWFKSIQLLGGNSPVLVILNKKNYKSLSSFDLKTYSERYSDLLIDYFPINLAEDEDFDYLVIKIQKMLYNLKHIGDKLPKGWILVREELEKLKFYNYINVEKYFDICKRYGIIDEDTQLSLSSYLHDLGVILHFKDDSNLYNFVILNPQWIVDAIYAVLSDRKEYGYGGKFTRNWLFDFWNEKGYSHEEKLKLLSLMQKNNFDICYKCNNKTFEESFIVPQLLTSIKPNYTWNEYNNLRFRFQYPFLPKGIISQLIVRLYNFLDFDKNNRDIAWKQGAVFVYNDNISSQEVLTKAEVIEEIDPDGLKVINIKISGISPDKKSFLAIVIKEIKEVHSKFINIRVKEQIPCNCEKCKNDNQPTFYDYYELKRRLYKKIYKVECKKDFDTVDILSLIDDVIERNPNEQVSSTDKKVVALPTPEKSDTDQGMMNYHDFQILVTEDSTIRASSEQGEESGKLQLDRNAIELALELIESRQTNAKLLKAVGSQLYQVLFPTKIHGQLRATIASAQADGYEVRLRLVFKSAELAALPWEFLYDEATNTFLANNTQTALSRYIDIPLQKRDLKAASLPLKILLAISSPTNLAQLNVAEEERLIRKALAKHIDAGQIELDVLQEATIRNINQKLREKPYNVFHFIGHGVFENHKGFIALVDNDGQYKLLDDEGFANLFLGNRSLGLAVLNSCQGAAVSSQQVFAGIAPNLVRRGIPAVVAMQYSILDTTAKLFADEFYRALALGWPIDAAIQTTRNAISIEVGLDKPDFATPVLYMRAKDGIILSGL